MTVHDAAYWEELHTRVARATELSEEVTPEILKALAGNGSLHIDTDVDLYDEDSFAAQMTRDWGRYFTFNTVNRLLRTGYRIEKP